MAVQKVLLKNDRGFIIGELTIQENGDRIMRDYYGRILGTYTRSIDITKDFYGRIVGYGDLLGTLLHS